VDISVFSTGSSIAGRFGDRVDPPAVDSVRKICRRGTRPIHSWAPLRGNGQVQGNWGKNLVIFKECGISFKKIMPVHFPPDFGLF